MSWRINRLALVVVMEGKRSKPSRKIVALSRFGRISLACARARAPSPAGVLVM